MLLICIIAGKNPRFQMKSLIEKMKIYETFSDKYPDKKINKVIEKSGELEKYDIKKFLRNFI